MPAMMGKEKAQKKLIADLGGVFRSTMKQFNLAPGDFPDLEIFKQKCLELNFSKFPKLKPKMLQDLDEVLQQDIPRLMEMLPQSLIKVEEANLNTANSTPAIQFDDMRAAAAAASLPAAPVRQVSASASTSAVVNPFTAPIPAAARPNPFGGSSKALWALDDEMAELSDLFSSLGPVSGKLEAAVAAQPLMQTGLTQDALRVIWDLSDIDTDGALDLKEFTLAMHLCNMVKAGEAVPDRLPQELIPPGKVVLG